MFHSFKPLNGTLECCVLLHSMAARGACALSRRGRLLAAARLSELCRWSSSAIVNCSASSQLSGRLEAPQQNYPPPDGASAAEPQRLGKLIDTPPSEVPFCGAHSLQSPPVDRRLHRCMSSHAAAGVAAGSTATSTVGSATALDNCNVCSLCS
jgi:hypothetical protein